MGIKVTVKPYKGHPTYKYRVFYPDGGKRRTKNFKKKREAEMWARDKQTQIAKSGTEQADITKEERLAVMQFRTEAGEIDGFDGSLADAVSHYLEHIKLTLKPYTCLEVTGLLIDRMDMLELSKRHIDSTKSRLKHFNAEYGDRKARDITKPIIEDYLKHLNLAHVTVVNARLTLSALFAHAVREGAASTNPVTEVELAKVKTKKPGILMPSEVALLLSKADDRVVPAIVLSFFAGLRRSEIEGLKWQNIDFKDNEINVPEEIAKNNKERWVDISDNLRAWLLEYRQQEGHVVQSPQIHRTGIEKAREAGKIKWKKNAGRHSFATFYLAKHRHGGETAIQLGHPNPTMLERHYKSTVKQARNVADTYWSIVPEKASNITDIKAS